MPTPARALRFAVAVTCIDGRIQDVVREHVRTAFGVDHVDVVTLPGADGALAGPGAARSCALDGIATSRDAHGSEVVAVVGHTDCAGNPGDAARHVRDLHAAVEWLRTSFPDLVPVGLLVDTDAGRVHDLDTLDPDVLDTQARTGGVAS